MVADQINSGFELVAGVLLTLNVLKLYHDKQVHGICIVPTAFMALWGLWNLYFYPSLGAWWSFWAGVLVVSVNVIWVGQMLYYKKQKSLSGQALTKQCFLSKQALEDHQLALRKAMRKKIIF